MPFFRLGKRSQQYNVANKDLFVIPIELLTNEAIECTLFASSLGQECLANVCAKIGLTSGAEYFGLLFRNARRGVDQWVDLGRPLKKQLDKWAEEPVRLLFRLQFFVPNFNFLADEITRYHYFCAMKGLVVEGRIGCTREDAILLASFSLQAEFGDYTPERHTVEYLNNFALFPKGMTAGKGNPKLTNDLLIDCAIAAYRNLQGVPTAVAEIYYICEAQQREGHGQEGFPARDLDTGQEVCLGVYIRGIFVVKSGEGGGGRKQNHHHHHNHQQQHQREVEFFRWHDIANLMHNKKVFIVERSCPGNNPDEVLNSRKNYATFDPDFAAAVWRCAVEQHQLFMKGHSLHTWQTQNHSLSEQNSASSVEGDYATPQLQPPQMSTTPSSSTFHPFLANDFFLGYEHFLAQKNALATQIAPTLAAATAAAASATAAAAAASSISAAGMDSNSSLVELNGGGHYGSFQQYHLHHQQNQQQHPNQNSRSSVSTGSLYETIKSSGSVSSGSKPLQTKAVDANGNGGNGTIITPSSSKVPTPKPRSSTEPIELHHIALQNCSSTAKSTVKTSESFVGHHLHPHPHSNHHHHLQTQAPPLTYTQKKLQSKTAAASAAVNNSVNANISAHNGTSSPKIISTQNSNSNSAIPIATPIYENQLHSSDLTFEQRKKLLPPYRSPPDYGEFIKRKAAAAAAAAASKGSAGTTTMASLSQSMGSIPSRLASQSIGSGAGVSSNLGTVGASASSTSLIGPSNGVGPRGGGRVVHSASMMSVPLALQQQQQHQQRQQLLYQQYQQYQTKQQKSNLQHTNSLYNQPKPTHLEVHRGSLPPPELPPRTASQLLQSHHYSNLNLLQPSSPQTTLNSSFGQPKMGSMFTAASSPELNNLHSLLHFQKQQHQQQQQQQQRGTNQHVMQLVHHQQQNNHQYHQQQHQLPNQHQFPPLQPNSTARPEVFAHQNRSKDDFDRLQLQHRPCFTSVPDLTFTSSSSHENHGSQTGLARLTDLQHQQQQQQSNLNQQKHQLQTNGYLANGGKTGSSSSSKGSFFAAFPLGKNLRKNSSKHTTGSVPNLAANSAYQLQHQQQHQSNLQLHQQYNSRGGGGNNALKTRRSTEALNYWGMNHSQNQNQNYHQQRSNSITVLEQQQQQQQQPLSRQQMMFSSYSISNRIDEAPELAAAAAAALASSKHTSSEDHLQPPTPTPRTSSPAVVVPPPTNVYSLQGHQQQQQQQQPNLQSQGQPQPKQQVIYANVGGQQAQSHQQQESQQELPPKTNHQLQPNQHTSNGFQPQQTVIPGVSDPRAAEAVANYINCVQQSSAASSSSSSSAITSSNNNNNGGNSRPPNSSQKNPISPSATSRIVVFNSENFHDQDFTREFELLPRMNPTAKFTTASLPENALRNRFRDILPYEENRVKLTPTKENKTGYINASHVYMSFGSMRQHYIAAQGPLPATTLDFWAMIIEHSISIICMVTNFTESGVGKCYSYLPLNAEPGENAIKFGDYEIICTHTTSTTTFVTSYLTVIYGNQKRSVTHLRYTDWNDHSIPGDLHGFLSFLAEMDAIHRRSTREGSGLGFKLKAKLLQKKNANSSVSSISSSDSPILVHCSAGAGRSGVVILCDALLKCLDHALPEPIDIPRALIQLRFQRMISVQHCEQFRFVCQVLSQYLSNSRLI